MNGKNDDKINIKTENLRDSMRTNTKINTDLHDLCENITKKVYNKISKNNGGDINKKKIDKLIDKIYPEIEKDFSTIKKKKKSNIKEGEMCMSRKIDGERCTRRKIGLSDYCKCHTNKRPNGRYDEEMVPKVKGKRGRRRKYELDERLFDKNYLTVWEEFIDGDRYLIDNKCRVFTYDFKSPTFLGIKTLEGTIEKKKKN